jgi:hypothetical protein
MGFCGRKQPAYINKEYHRDHGLCVKFFNAAFNHNFYAQDANFNNCFRVKEVAKFPENFKMGYMETYERKRSDLNYFEFSILFIN